MHSDNPILMPTNSFYNNDIVDAIPISEMADGDQCMCIKQHLQYGSTDDRKHLTASAVWQY
jgi:hypothetical protein